MNESSPYDPPQMGPVPTAERPRRSDRQRGLAMAMSALLSGAGCGLLAELPFCEVWPTWIELIAALSLSPFGITFASGMVFSQKLLPQVYWGYCFWPFVVLLFSWQWWRPQRWIPIALFVGTVIAYFGVLHGFYAMMSV